LAVCPADRPERFEKAAAWADVVILDLEDGLAPADRPSARIALADSRLDPQRTVTRINPHESADHNLDLEAVRETAYFRVMLAKTESAAQAAALAPLQLIALCETPRGVLIMSRWAPASEPPMIVRRSGQSRRRSAHDSSSSPTAGVEIPVTKSS
jgi:citrate lyase subunit beta/citryl-CoA lyase